MEPRRNRYFDNASTSYPKPEAVYAACDHSLRHVTGSPGRSGHAGWLDADRLVYRARQAVALLFNVPDPARMVFTLNTTDALNMAIKGVLEAGDHVLYTAMEHNAVLRPLAHLRREGRITTAMVPCSPEGYPDLDFLQRALKTPTRLLVVNHMSNVLGNLLPIDTMVSLAHERGAYVLVDAAQSAGSVPIDLTAVPADLLAFAGHKGLWGPPGTGGLYVGPGVTLRPWREGGTGGRSGEEFHPEWMPDRLEAGTCNVPGLAGLCAGIRFVEETGAAVIRAHAHRSRDWLRRNLERVTGATVHGPLDSERCGGVLSVSIAGVDCAQLCAVLADRYGLIGRAGLHCAPLAHRAAGTYPEGTLRLSPGFFTTEADMDYLVGAIDEAAGVLRA